MKKLLSILFLASVLMVSSGFGAIENSTYVQSETTINSKANFHKVNFNEKKVIIESPEEVDSESISEKIGGILITSINLMVKAFINFMASILN
jgi:hypothetical protein